MDIYTKNGLVVRHFPNGDGSTAVEIDFLFEEDGRAEIYRLAACYKVFCADFSVSFVLNIFSGQRIVLMLEEFTNDVQAALVSALLKAREEGDRLFFLAREKYFQKYGGSIICTNELTELEKYSTYKLRHRDFWEKCREILTETENDCENPFL